MKPYAEELTDEKIEKYSTQDDPNVKYDRQKRHSRRKFKDEMRQLNRLHKKSARRRLNIEIEEELDFYNQ